MLLHLEHVSKQYETPSSPLVVLKDINLEVREGEAISIIGPSGSGKSTLLNIIGTLDKATSGRILLDGRDFADIDEKQTGYIRNKKIGFVFQSHYLLPQLSAFENVLLPTLAGHDGGNSDETEHRARALLERVGLKNRLTHLPSQLSGGECQRVAVVRAMINQPKLLLADEPTGSLDAGSSDELGSLLLELNHEESLALITVTHSESLARRMGTRYTLKQGELQPGQSR